MSTNMAERPTRQVKKSLAVQRMMMREQQRNKIKEVRRLLKKSKLDLTTEESNLLDEHANIVTQIQQRIEKHRSVSDRTKEVVDSPDVLEVKCQQLADAIRAASSLIVYTGAGISTAAKIPDYRGPEGVWTLLRQGKKIEVPDLSMADPTFTHLMLKQMQRLSIVKHVVSQNCDGLHMRSGLPPKSLSEIHGNMFIEVCMTCKPVKQYIRLFDVTENTGLHRHYTGRVCIKCGSELKDTIVHFGEKGKVAWPLNWKGAAKASDQSDVVLCLGSSLKVLRRYPCLWANHKPASKRPKLFIVNLQWTPKDTHCTLKINAKCDDVMEHLASILNIEVPSYVRDKDPIFQLATPLTDEEKDTTTRKSICPLSPSVKMNCSPANNESFVSTSSKIEVAMDQNTHCDMLSTVISKSENSLLNLSSTKEEEIDLPVIKTDVNNDIPSLHSGTGISGWYGKGCAKLKKPRKRQRL